MYSIIYTVNYTIQSSCFLPSLRDVIASNLRLPQTAQVVEHWVRIILHDSPISHGWLFYIQGSPMWHLQWFPSQLKGHTPHLADASWHLATSQVLGAEFWEPKAWPIRFVVVFPEKYQLVRQNGWKKCPMCSSCPMCVILIRCFPILFLIETNLSSAQHFSLPCPGRWPTSCRARKPHRYRWYMA